MRIRKVVFGVLATAILPTWTLAQRAHLLNPDGSHLGHKSGATQSDPNQPFTVKKPDKISAGLIEERIDLHFKEARKDCSHGDLKAGEQPKPLLNQLDLSLEKARTMIARDTIAMNNLVESPPDWEVEELNQVLTTSLHVEPANHFTRDGQGEAKNLPSQTRAMVQDYFSQRAGHGTTGGMFSVMWFPGEQVFGNTIYPERNSPDFDAIDPRRGYPKTLGLVLRSGAGIDVKPGPTYEFYLAGGGKATYHEDRGPFMHTRELVAKHGRISKYLVDKEKHIEEVKANQQWLINEAIDLGVSSAAALFFPPAIGLAAVATSALKTLASGAQGKIKSMASKVAKGEVPGAFGKEILATYDKIESSYNLCSAADKVCTTPKPALQSKAGEADYFSMFDPQYLLSLSDGKDSMKEVHAALQGEFKGLLPDMRSFSTKLLSMRDIIGDENESDVGKRTNNAYVLATEVKNKIDVVDQAMEFALRDLKKACTASIKAAWSELKVPSDYRTYTTHLRDQANSTAGQHTSAKFAQEESDRAKYAMGDKIYRQLRNSNIDLVMAKVGKKKSECIAGEIAIRQQRLTWFTNIAYLTNLTCKQTKSETRKAKAT